MKVLKLSGIKEHELKQNSSNKNVYTKEELEAMKRLEEKLQKDRLLKPTFKKKRNPICRQRSSESINAEIERAM